MSDATGTAGGAVVFGGGAGWGARIVEALARLGEPPAIVERDTPAEQADAAVDAAGLVFVAIPDDGIAALLERLAPRLGGKCLIDCASNKSGFAAALERIALAGASVCSTHPMVVASTSPRGHTVLIMPVGPNASAATGAARAIYAALGMSAQAFEFDRHGDAMTIVQMVPHLVQRMLIQALAHGIASASMTIDDIARIAPANYLLAELGLGRVAAQRPDVSAGIIATALQAPFGRQVVADLRELLDGVLAAGANRAELAGLFAASIATLDPSGAWREQMTTRTEVALIRLGNLRSRHFVVEAPNRRGVLRDILSILIDQHAIDMTALDSQVVLDDSGAALARFEIGVTDEHVDFVRLASDLRLIGARLVGPGAA